MPSLQIIYASTSGHTEYVCDQLIASLKEKGVEVTKLSAERANPEDLSVSGPLVLASSTWNTGNAEGQLNPYMYWLLMEQAKDVQLKGRKIACIGLGDNRYRYLARAADHLEEFVKTHGGELLCDTLRIVNEPYGQEQALIDWAQKLLPKLS